MKKQDFKVLKTKDLYPFPDNPFHVVEDETLSELAESIKEFGIVTPIITRPKEDGDGYIHSCQVQAVLPKQKCVQTRKGLQRILPYCQGT